MASPKVVKRVLFVCFANTCRSTMAEAIFLHLIAQRKESNQWLVDSAGTSSYSCGYPPNPRTVSTLKKNGISLENYSHVSRVITLEDYNNFDIIFGMDEYNLMDLKEDEPRGGCRAALQLLGEWDPQGERIIYDPLFTNGTEAFDIVYHQCMRSLTAFLHSSSHT